MHERASEINQIFLYKYRPKEAFYNSRIYFFYLRLDMADSLPKFLLLHENSEEMHDGRIANIKKYEEIGDKAEMVVSKRIHSKINLENQLPQKGTKFNNIEYSSRFGVLLKNTKDGVALISKDLFEEEIKNGKQQKLDYKIVSKNNGQLILSPDEEKLAICGDQSITIILMNNLQEKCVIKCKNLDQFLWVDNQNIAAFKFQGVVFTFNTTSGSQAQIPQIDSCTGLSIINKKLMILQQTKFTLYDIDKKNKLKSFSLPQQKMDQIHMYFSFCSFISIFKVNVRMDYDKFLVKDEEFGEDDIYCLMSVYYKDEEDEESVRNQRYYSFIKGNLMGNEVNLQVIKFENFTSTNDTDQNSYMYFSDKKKLNFNKKILYCGDFVIISFERSERVYVINCSQIFQLLEVYPVKSKHELIEESGYFLEGACLMRNMLKFEKQLPQDQSDNKLLKEICKEYSGQFMSLYFADKETNATLQFPLSLLAISKDKIFRRYAVSTLEAIDKDDDQLILSEIKKIKKSKFITEVKGKINKDSQQKEVKNNNEVKKQSINPFASQAKGSFNLFNPSKQVGGLFGSSQKKGIFDSLKKPEENNYSLDKSSQKAPINSDIFASGSMFNFPKKKEEEEKIPTLENNDQKNADEKTQKALPIPFSLNNNIFGVSKKIDIFGSKQKITSKPILQQKDEFTFQKKPYPQNERQKIPQFLFPSEKKQAGLQKNNQVKKKQQVKKQQNATNSIFTNSTNKLQSNSIFNIIPKTQPQKNQSNMVEEIKSKIALKQTKNQKENNEQNSDKSPNKGIKEIYQILKQTKKDIQNKISIIFTQNRSERFFSIQNVINEINNQPKQPQQWMQLIFGQKILDEYQLENLASQERNLDILIRNYQKKKQVNLEDDELLNDKVQHISKFVDRFTYYTHSLSKKQGKRFSMDYKKKGSLLAYKLMTIHSQKIQKIEKSLDEYSKSLQKQQFEPQRSSISQIKSKRKGATFSFKQFCKQKDEQKMKIQKIQKKRKPKSYNFSKLLENELNISKNATNISAKEMSLKAKFQLKPLIQKKKNFQSRVPKQKSKVEVQPLKKSVKVEDQPIEEVLSESAESIEITDKEEIIPTSTQRQFSSVQPKKKEHSSFFSSIPEVNKEASTLKNNEKEKKPQEKINNKSLSGIPPTDKKKQKQSLFGKMSNQKESKQEISKNSTKLGQTKKLQVEIKQSQNNQELNKKLTKEEERQKKKENLLVQKKLLGQKKQDKSMQLKQNKESTQVKKNIFGQFTKNEKNDSINKVFEKKDKSFTDFFNNKKDVPLFGQSKKEQQKQQNKELKKQQDIKPKENSKQLFKQIPSANINIFGSANINKQKPLFGVKNDEIIAKSTDQAVKKQDKTQQKPSENSFFGKTNSTFQNAQTTSMLGNQPAFGVNNKFLGQNDSISKPSNIGFDPSKLVGFQSAPNKQIKSFGSVSISQPVQQNSIFPNSPSNSNMNSQPNFQMQGQITGNNNLFSGNTQGGMMNNNSPNQISGSLFGNSQPANQFTSNMFGNVQKSNPSFSSNFSPPITTGNAPPNVPDSAMKPRK